MEVYMTKTITEAIEKLNQEIRIIRKTYGEYSDYCQDELIDVIETELSRVEAEAKREILQALKNDTDKLVSCDNDEHNLALLRILNKVQAALTTAKGEEGK